jgi:fructose-bisphosphate aldolase class I
MPVQDLNNVARLLVPPSKGVLASDESLGTIQKRFDSIGIENNVENRRTYREILFSTAGLEEYISGVILFDETIKDKDSNGKSFSQVLSEKGIVPGIKVDKGKIELPNFPGEFITEGLDGLTDRLKEYYDLGAKFTKWRAEINIGDKIPSLNCISSNSEALARFAALSQAANLVPMVEPEVMMKGTHNIDRSREVTASTLQNLFLKLKEHSVDFSKILLKINMVMPGDACTEKVSPETIATETVNLFKKFVPKEVPGIVFLSGGQSSEEATENLNAINQIKDAPWPLSFSFGRALQDEALKVWAGNPSNKEAAQKALLKRAKLVSLARQGEYRKDMENE